MPASPFRRCPERTDSDSHTTTNRIMEYLELNDDLENAQTSFYAVRSATSTHDHSWMLDYNYYGNRNNEPLTRQVEANGWRFTFICTNAQLKSSADTFQSATFMVFLTLPE